MDAKLKGVLLDEASLLNAFPCADAEVLSRRMATVLRRIAGCDDHVVTGETVVDHARKALQAERARLTTMAERCRQEARNLRRQAEKTEHPFERKRLLDKAQLAEEMAADAESDRTQLEREQ
jgi:hypothetical protein